MAPSVSTSPWFDDHTLVTLTSPGGVTVQVGSYGATLVSVQTPDRDGTLDEIVLGFDGADGWRRNAPYFGSTVGRYANRIAGGQFALAGTSVSLPCNLGAHHLHGGPHGFSHRGWSTRVLDSVPGAASDTVGVTFSLRSPAGDQGYPGAVSAECTYTLDAAGRLTATYRAKSDAPTHVNLTNHSYWNLAGTGQDASEISTVDAHELELSAAHFTPTDELGIPTGEVRSVAGTGLDFRTARTLGAVDGETGNPHAYDHNFVLDAWDGSLRPAALLADPESGRTLGIRTTCPGVQLYTPDFGGDMPGARDGGAYRGRQAVCLETQFFPDSPNQPDFPSTRLDPGQVWEHMTVWEFGVA